jgi:hypothetical protein
MRRTLLVLFLLPLAGACDDSPARRFPAPRPSPLEPPAPLPPWPWTRTPVTNDRAIAVGEEVTARLTSQDHYTLTVPRDGTIVVTLAWDSVWESLLSLKIDDRDPDTTSSPIVSRMAVVAGREYTLSVGFVAVEHDWVTEYTLVTRLE